MTEYRDRFIGLFRKHIEREGSLKLLDWLDTTDFFVAPASTKFHSACKYGLVSHSLNVFDVMMKNEEISENKDKLESIAISALLHDLCKVEFYKESTRNVKNEQTGAWEKVPYYSIEDKFPFGHGEKSVYLIERFFKLKNEEAIAIRWHMGGFDSDAKVGGYSVSNAFSKYPLAVKLHVADLQATYLLEND